MTTRTQLARFEEPHARAAGRRSIHWSHAARYRSFRRAAHLVQLCIAAVLLSSGVAPAHGERLREARPLMGTVVEIAAEGRDPSALRIALAAAFDEMRRLSDMMNHYDPRSVVSAINDAAGIQPVSVPPELMEVLEAARRVSERSAGAFDVTVGSLRGWRFRPDDPRMPTREQIAAQLPLVDYRKLVLDRSAGSAFLVEPGMRIDLGGIAKLYILERGGRVLERHGVARALVNGGGDVVFFGATREVPWRIGVRDPRAPDRLLGILEVQTAHGIVASSGDYERYFIRDGKRYHHILDPRTGLPTEGPHGVTLVGERLEAVNGLGPAVMVLGKPAGMRLIGSTPGLDGLVVDRDGTVWMSPGFRARLHLAP
jgi:thiamine biosynthesis lipoprotein